MPSVNPTTYLDFVNATREVRAFGKNEIINMAIREGTYAVQEMLRGRTAADIAGGTRLEETVFVKDPATFQSYVPENPRSVQRTQSTAKIVINHRSKLSYDMWGVTDLVLNGEASPDAVMKNLSRIRDAKQKTDHFNGLEDLCWKQANATAMEILPSLAQGSDFYSINTLLTEDDPAIQSTPPGWGASTLGGISTSEANWRNPVAFYSVANRADPVALNGLVSAIDEMSIRLAYSPPAQIPGLQTIGSVGPGMLVLTNQPGMKLLMNLIRRLNDGAGAAPGGDMGSPSIMYNGCKFMYHKPLDTAPINQTRAVAGTDSVYATVRTTFHPDEPRFYFVNKFFFKPRFIEGYFMHMPEAKDGGASMPDAYVQYTESWGNFVCYSRQRCGVVAPATSTVV